MPRLHTSDGIDLYYEETGAGAPIVFVHELAGDFRSFEPQIRYFPGPSGALRTTREGIPLPMFLPIPTATRRIGPSRTSRM